MKPGRNLSDLAQELQRQACAKRDFVAPTDLLTMTSGATLDCGEA